MNFNNVVNQAVKDRDNLKSHQRGSLYADYDLKMCRLSICPFNGQYIEQPIGFWSYRIENGDIVRRWN